MRKGIAGLPTAHPIGHNLPAVYLDDDFTQRLTAACDEVLAPVLTTLDCFAAYLDPRLAPPDLLDWLAEWVALAVDDSWPEQQRRELIANGVELHRWRGTRRGLAAHVELLTGAEVEVVDSGGCTWSPRPEGPLPGESRPWIEIRVRVSSVAAVDSKRLVATVTDALPAHVPATVRVVGVGRARVGEAGDTPAS
ncbi:MAG TPA: phage tail protein [Rugosimonospora sp.]|nr:phage tail protein [Rugosimonospora sp.]